MELMVIPRKERFSPNHVGNDRAILSLVLKLLEDRGYRCYLYEEDQFLHIPHPTDIPIVTMARSKELIYQLQKMEQAGTRIINSAFGIENCYRENMTLKLIESGIPHPESMIVATSGKEKIAFDLLDSKGYWIKRSDFHALHREDVSYVRHEQEGIELLAEYHSRGIERAVISAHLPGDLVKFYGVKGTGFFYWFYPYDADHQKFQEYRQVNGESRHFPFDAKLLQQTAESAAAVLGIHIYGGDAIIAQDGDFKLIDMNDWPSFAPCREQAAPYMAEAILTEIKRTRHGNYNINQHKDA